jgi:hypothetical protein
MSESQVAERRATGSREAEVYPVTLGNIQAVLRRNDPTRLPAEDELQGVSMSMALLFTARGQAQILIRAMIRYRARRDKLGGAKPFKSAFTYLREELRDTIRACEQEGYET